MSTENEHEALGRSFEDVLEQIGEEHPGKQVVVRCHYCSNDFPVIELVRSLQESGDLMVWFNEGEGADFPGAGFHFRCPSCKAIGRGEA